MLFLNGRPAFLPVHYHFMVATHVSLCTELPGTSTDRKAVRLLFMKQDQFHS